MYFYIEDNASMLFMTFFAVLSISNWVHPVFHSQAELAVFHSHEVPDSLVKKLELLKEIPDLPDLYKIIKEDVFPVEQQAVNQGISCGNLIIKHSWYGTIIYHHAQSGTYSCFQSLGQVMRLWVSLQCPLFAYQPLMSNKVIIYDYILEREVRSFDFSEGKIEPIGFTHDGRSFFFQKKQKNHHVGNHSKVTTLIYKTYYHLSYDDLLFLYRFLYEKSPVIF